MNTIQRVPFTIASDRFKDFYTIYNNKKIYRAFSMWFTYFLEKGFSVEGKKYGEVLLYDKPKK